MISESKVAGGVRGEYGDGEKHQIQLSRNLSPANNRPLGCRLADAAAL
jgi:hypothetical protein